ncbi:hypothetical protein ACLUUI_15625 [Enterobacterales bacterium AW_CKDN230030176-1A_HGKHYDSX7]
MSSRALASHMMKRCSVRHDVAAPGPSLARRRLAVLLTLALIGGCQSTAERLLAEGYPPPFVDGFTDGCTSGRHAAGELDDFRKNVPAYLQQPNYALGWDDGFRQCQARADSEIERRLARDSEADRAWRQGKDQAWGQALRPSSRTP